MTKTRVLIVEDDFLIRMTLRDALDDDGFDVEEAGDAGEALTVLGAGAPIDVLLTDIQLPGGRDGHELILAARAMQPDLPVIVTSGRPGGGSSVGGSGPASVFINKPYVPSQICEAARSLAKRTPPAGDKRP